MNAYSQNKGCFQQIILLLLKPIVPQIDTKVLINDCIDWGVFSQPM